MIEVSILIPCYNVERWVRQAVDSALSQTYTRCEVICVDDGSTDGTLDILLSYGSQIRLETGPNRGGNVTRNRLLSLSRGSWVQYLDADDYLESDKISRHVQSLTQDASADVLYGEVTIEQIDAQGSLQTDVETIPGTDDVWRLLIEWSLPQTGGAFWKKEALFDVGGWKIDQVVCQEHELYLRLLKAGKKFRRDSGGAVYRIWSEETVCRRDPLLTMRSKLDVISQVETWLSQTGMLTNERYQAILQARLESARLAMNFDRQYAYELADQVQQMSPGFMPSPAPAFPSTYRWLYRYLGFTVSEQIASWKRSLLMSSKSK